MAAQNEVDLDAVRAQLNRELASTGAQLAGMTRPVERGAAQGFGKRIGDGTVEAISRLTDIGVGRSMETKQMKIERALQKLDEGTYGICDSCGQPIMPARLRAMPASAVCVPCADRAPRVPSPRR
jgi:DnaK suppressor protein